MRIGDFVKNSTNMVNAMNRLQGNVNKSQQRIANGGKKLAADDPSAIGRIERYKSQVSASKIAQNSLDFEQLRNTSMQNTLHSVASNAGDLQTLSMENAAPGADKATIATQAASVLDSMVSKMANASYNGTNPFGQGDVTYAVSGGNTTFKGTKFNIAKNAGDPTKYDITLNDGTSLAAQSVTDILASGFVSTNLQGEASKAVSQLGTNENLIGYESDFEAKNEETLTSALSNVEDIDVTKETMNMAKDNAMIQINNQLLSAFTSSFTTNISRLLNNMG